MNFAQFARSIQSNVAQVIVGKTLESPTSSEPMRPGRRVTATRVVYLALEGEFGFRQRLHAWQLHQGRDAVVELLVVP